MSNNSRPSPTYEIINNYATNMTDHQPRVTTHKNLTTSLGWWFTTNMTTTYNKLDDQPRVMIYNKCDDQPRVMIYNKCDNQPRVIIYNKCDDQPWATTYNKLDDQPRVMTYVRSSSSSLTALSALPCFNIKFVFTRSNVCKAADFGWNVIKSQKWN